MADISYTIYRKMTLGDSDGRNVAALVHCGVEIATGPKRALSDWFDGLRFEEQAAMNGDATFIVVPTGNHHELSPKVEAQPRLVF